MMRKIILALFIVFLLSSCNMFELNKRELNKVKEFVTNLEELDDFFVIMAGNFDSQDGFYVYDENDSYYLDFSIFSYARKDYRNYKFRYDVKAKVLYDGNTILKKDLTLNDKVEFYNYINNNYLKEEVLLNFNQVIPLIKDIYLNTDNMHYTNTNIAYIKTEIKGELLNSYPDIINYFTKINSDFVFNEEDIYQVSIGVDIDYTKLYPTFIFGKDNNNYISFDGVFDFIPK